MWCPRSFVRIVLSGPAGQNPTAPIPQEAGLRSAMPAGGSSLAPHQWRTKAQALPPHRGRSGCYITRGLARARPECAATIVTSRPSRAMK